MRHVAGIHGQSGEQGERHCLAAAADFRVPEHLAMPKHTGASGQGSGRK